MSNLSNFIKAQRSAIGNNSVGEYKTVKQENRVVSQPVAQQVPQNNSQSNLSKYIRSQTAQARKSTSLQTAGEKSPAVSLSENIGEPVSMTSGITTKEKYGNTLFAPASAWADKNEKRNKLNYVVNENYRTTSSWGINNPYAQLDYINEDERLTVADYVAKKDYDSAYDYLESISKNLNERMAKGETEQVKKFAKEHPLMAGVASVADLPFGALQYAENLIQYGTDKLQGKKTDYDINSNAFSTDRFGEAVNETLMKDQGIVGQLVRGVGLSAGEQLSSAAVGLGGKLTEVLMAAQRGQSSLYENLKKGIDSDRAVLNSLGKAYITYEVEKRFPASELLGMSKESVANGLWSHIKKSSLSEGLEEVAENIISNVWDTVQLKDKSDIAQLVQSYKDQGYNKTDAALKAMVEVYLYDSLMSGASGALAGGLMGGGAVVVNNFVNRGTRNTNQQDVEQAQQTDNTASNRRFSVQEYADTLTETAKGNAVNYLNSEYKNTGITAAQYAENNLDGTFYKQNKLYYMEKDGKRIPVPKTIHDYATYLQNNVVKTQLGANQTIVTSPNELIEETAINDNPIGHSSDEMKIINEFKESVDVDMVRFIEDTVNGKYDKPYVVSNNSSNAIKKALELTGLDSVGTEIVLDDNGLKHIFKRHGDGGKADNTMSNVEDIARMKYVLDNFDNAYLSVDKAEGYSTKSGKPAPIVMYEKKVDGHYIVIEAVSDSKKNKCFIISAYMSKDGIPDNKKAKVEQQPPMANDKIVGRDTAKPSTTDTFVNSSIPQETPKNQDNLPESVGAMKSGYYAAIDKYGAFPEGENATNPVDVPMSIDGEHGVTRGIRTIMEAAATAEEMLNDYEQAIAAGEFNYDIKKDKPTVEKAVSYIEKYGYENTYNEWRKKIDNGQQITKDDMVQAQIMYSSAVAIGDYETALKLATDIAHQATKAGQVVQSMRVLKKTTPEGRLYYAQKSVDAIQEEINEKYGDKAPEIEVPKSLLEAIQNATTDEEIREATININKHIAEQLPFSWSNFITGWRYLSMLGNTRTQVRNIVSNTVGMMAQEYTNFVQTGIETVANKAGKNVQKTSAIKSTDWQKQAAEADFELIKDKLYGSKYRNDSLKGIEKLQNPFDFKGKGGVVGDVAGKVLTKWNEATNWAMDEGDKLFSGPAYKRYYARYLAANNINTEEQLTSKVKMRARAWATKQSQEIVYRETNELAESISKLETKLAQSSNPTVRTGAKIVGGLMPFRGTPLNITKRAFEYTPVGIAMELANHKNSNPTEIINKTAKSLSGTSLMLVGYALAKSGILTGGLSNDKEDKMKKQMGEQAYSINIGDTSYTLDWGGAAVMPLFVGAQMYEQTAENSENFFAAMLDTFANASAPIMETSMMTGLMDALTSASYEDNMAEKITSFLSSGLASYLGQFIPTLLGQVARSVDDTSRSSYTNVKGVLKPLAKTVQKAENKIPFLSTTNVPYMDVWGNDEKNVGGNFIGRLLYNTLSPGYISTKSTDNVENMLMDIYKETGDNSVLPSNYTTYKRMGDETIRFTDKQYEQYTKAYGQTAYNLLDDLTNSSGFKSLEDAYKAELVSKVYKYSTAIASNEVVDKSLETRQANQKKALDNGVSAYYVFGGLIEADTNGNQNGNLSKSEVIDYIEGVRGLDNIQKAYLFAALGNSNWKNPYA